MAIRSPGTCAVPPEVVRRGSQESCSPDLLMSRRDPDGFAGLGGRNCFAISWPPCDLPESTVPSEKFAWQGAGCGSGGRVHDRSTIRREYGVGAYPCKEPTVAAYGSTVGAAAGPAGVVRGAVHPLKSPCRALHFRAQSYLRPVGWIEPEQSLSPPRSCQRRVFLLRDKPAVADLGSETTCLCKEDRLRARSLAAVSIVRLCAK